LHECGSENKEEKFLLCKGATGPFTSLAENAYFDLAFGTAKTEAGGKEQGVKSGDLNRDCIYSRF
jgi:hypothetical protein